MNLTNPMHIENGVIMRGIIVVKSLNETYYLTIFLIQVLKKSLYKKA